MKIKTSRLIELIDAELKRIRRSSEERRLRDVDRAERAREEYVDKTSAAWQSFAENIRRVTAQREPITWEHVPRELRGPYGVGSINIWQPTKTRESYPAPEEHPDYRRLETLRSLLDVVEDDVISTYSLEKAGFRLERLLRGLTEAA